MTSRLYLVRHGENLANLTKEFSHRLVDHGLTPKGVLQSQQTAEYFINHPVDAIFSSPLQRAAQTARIIADRLGMPFTILEDFREANVGTLEVGPPSLDKWNLHNKIVEGWFDGRKEVSFPGGENYYELWERFKNGLTRSLDGNMGKTVMVVGHGGMFAWSLTALCPGVDPGWQSITVPSGNCAINEIMVEMQDGVPVGKLVRWAYIGHLSGEAANQVNPIASEKDFK